MAKNKNRERKQPQSESRQPTRQPSMERPAEQHAAPVTPGDMARKSREKRFGHN
jgi:hypothetical protein